MLRSAWLIGLLAPALGRADVTAPKGAVATRPPAALTYAVPLGDSKPAHVAFTEWRAGARLCVAVAVSQPCAGPGICEKPLPPLRFGSEVVVSEVGKERVTAFGRVNRWVAVKGPAGVFSGWVFGADLSNQCLREDLDGDGAPEVVALGFSDDLEIEVRVLRGSEPLRTVRFRAAGGAFLSRRGGNAQLSFVSARVAGMPLLQIDSQPEACADFSTTFVSLAGGTLQVALVLTGLADPPTHSLPSVEFDPRQKTAVVTQTNSTDEDGKSPVSRTRTRYRWSDGRFVEVPAK